MLKCEFHTHAKEDKLDHYLDYSYIDLFKIAKKFKYDFLPLTFHQNVFFNRDVKYYAKKYNIGTCPACEASIEGRDVLLYNITQAELKKIKDFDDCKDYFCIAPHPFYPFHSLNELAYKYKHIFDAVELSSVHAPLFNYWNNKAKTFALKHKIPLVATADAHHLWQLNKSFTLVDAASNKADDIFDAVRKNKIKPIQTIGSVIDIAKFVIKDAIIEEIKQKFKK